MADKYILVGIDGSEITQHLLQYAAWLSDSNELPIKIVHTIEHSHTSEQAHHEGNLTPNIRDELLKELTDETVFDSLWYFGPELTLCVTIVLLLLLRLFGFARRAFVLPLPRRQILCHAHRLLLLRLLH